MEKKELNIGEMEELLYRMHCYNSLEEKMNTGVDAIDDMLYIYTPIYWKMVDSKDHLPKDKDEYSDQLEGIIFQLSSWLQEYYSIDDFQMEKVDPDSIVEKYKSFSREPVDLYNRIHNIQKCIMERYHEKFKPD